MPTPSQQEKKSGKQGKSHYMSRCIPMLIKEGKPQAQAIAICSSMYDQNKKKKQAKGDTSEPDFDKDNDLGDFLFLPQ